MSEFDIPPDPIQGAGDKLPPNKRIDAINDKLNDKWQQQKLTEEKIKLFRWAVVSALIAFWLLVPLLIFVVIMYLYFLMKNVVTPSNFWHIPFLLAIMASTILSVTLGLASRFGDSHKKDKDTKDKDTPSTLANMPAWQQFTASLKELIQEIRK